MEILLIEDNPDHAELIMRALKGDSAIRVWLIRDGQEAMDFLLREGKHPKPHLILLDLKLPKIDGIEILKKLKQTPRLRSIPVVVLTTSAREEEIKKIYALGANSYLTKPGDFRKFIEEIRGIITQWT